MENLGTLWWTVFFKEVRPNTSYPTCSYDVTLPLLLLRVGVNVISPCIQARLLLDKVILCDF